MPVGVELLNFVYSILYHIAEDDPYSLNSIVFGNPVSPSDKGEEKYDKDSEENGAKGSMFACVVCRLQGRKAAAEAFLRHFPLTFLIQSSTFLLYVIIYIILYSAWPYYTWGLSKKFFLYSYGKDIHSMD